MKREGETKRDEVRMSAAGMKGVECGLTDWNGAKKCAAEIKDGNERGLTDWDGAKKCAAEMKGGNEHGLAGPRCESHCFRWSLSYQGG